MGKIVASPAQRKAIYGIVTAVITLLVAFGVITAEELSDLVAQGVTLLTAGATLLAYLNTDPNQEECVPFEDE